MKKIGIFYGSTLGNTQALAEKIKQAFADENVELYNIEKANSGDLEKCDNLILGTSTWGVGEMQEDWETFAAQLDTVDLSGKKIALFSVGDQVEWSDSFVNGMGMLYHKIADKEQVVGFTSLDRYNFEISLAVKNNMFVGLAIDNVNQSELTNDRVNNWVAELRKVFN